MGPAEQPRDTKTQALRSTGLTFILSGTKFIRADVLEVMRFSTEISGGQRLVCLPPFQAVHASPPCQSYSRAFKHMATPQQQLVDVVREWFQGLDLPWIIENVEGAPVARQDTLDGGYGVELCGTQFGLKVRHHRLFETSFPVSPPNVTCQHSQQRAMNPHASSGRRRIYEEYGRQDPEKLWRKEKGVEWMNKHEGREAIPPAYTEFIGAQLLERIKANA